MPRNGRGRYVRSDPHTENFGDPDRQAGNVSVDVGRGQNVEVPAGSDFVNTVEQLARDAHYGGFYKVFIAEGDAPMREVVKPSDAPETIEVGMRIAITSYDKVGFWGS